MPAAVFSPGSTPSRSARAEFRRDRNRAQIPRMNCGTFPRGRGSISPRSSSTFTRSFISKAASTAWMNPSFTDSCEIPMLSCAANASSAASRASA